MIVLALDSSSDTLSVALLRDGEPLAERVRRVARPHGEGLLPAVEALLSEAHVRLDEVEIVAVATGPGSFNGIRGGIATAQGLGLALGVGVVGVPTLDALAYQHVGRAPVVCALLPAGRGEFYSAAYAGTWQAWRRLGDYEVLPAADLIAAMEEGALLCGRIPADVAESAVARGLLVAPPVASVARASFVGALGASRLRAPGFDVAASLTPLYLRRPGITKSARLEAGPAGQGA